MIKAKNSWDELADVKVSELNKHHQKIIALFCKLQDAIVYSRVETEVAQILNELDEYTGYHFGAEEGYLSKYNYCQITEHIEEHQSFRRKIAEFKTSFKDQELKTSLDLLAHLQHWIFQHVAGTDKKYSDFLNQHGLH